MMGLGPLQATTTDKAEVVRRIQTSRSRAMAGEVANLCWPKLRSGPLNSEVAESKAPCQHSGQLLSMCTKRLELALNPIWITYLYGHVLPRLTSYAMHSSPKLAQGNDQEDRDSSVDIVEIGRHTREYRARSMVAAQRSTNAKPTLTLTDNQPPL